MGFSGTDYAPQDRIPGNPAVCQWGTAPLSKINLASYAHRLRTHFDALKVASQSPDAFEIGNELDLHCNDADMPTISEFAKHNWTWFLSDAQVHAWVAGYAPVLKTAATLIREYFPQALVITGGMSNPTGNSAPLIAALAHFTDSSGRTFDYTTLVDGYGTHIYPPADTTLHLVQHASSDLIAQAADLPHLAEKPLWITEWSENGSAFWSSHKWYFQYDSRGNIGGDLDLAQAPYGPMTRAQAIRTFTAGVIERLHTQANIGYVFYYFVRLGREIADVRPYSVQYEPQHRRRMLRRPHRSDEWDALTGHSGGAAALRSLRAQLLGLADGSRFDNAALDDLNARGSEHPPWPSGPFRSVLRTACGR